MPVHDLPLACWSIRTWTLFGQIPFVALMVLLYLAGRRRGWPWRSSVLVGAALAAGMALGARLLPSVLGAVAGGIVLWWLAQRVLGLGRAPLATLALGVVAVVALGRWGCLLNDCCFGRATDLPWAVHYGVGSATWLLHGSLGWIAADAPRSLPVHPYPLYDSLGLLLWLPLAFRLKRRLRSEAALLLFTAAYALALRAAIDGTRAMVNVWWALLGTRWGLGPFQWALLLAAFACLAAGVLIERRACQPAVPEVAPAPEPTPERLWAVFAGLLAVGWLGDAGGTLFLHRVLLCALAVSTLALRLPAWLPARRWLRVAAAPAFAAALVLAVGEHALRAARASGELAAIQNPSRGWLYEVDHQRAVLVRVGTQQESPASIEPRRAALGLPETTPAAAPSVAPAAKAGRTWVGGGFVGGAANYRVQNACSNDYVAYDRKVGGGWLQAEHELPAGPASVWWLGGRGSALFESQKKTVHTEGGPSDSVEDYGIGAYDGQIWAELEHPNISVGLGGMLGIEHRKLASGPSGFHAVARPAFRLRAGFSFLGLEGGAYDRQSVVGPTSARIGVSGTIGRGLTRIRHPDDTAVKYFLGAVVFPGADGELNHFLFGLGLEAWVTRRLALGLQGGVGEGGYAAGYLRTAIGN